MIRPVAVGLTLEAASAALASDRALAPATPVVRSFLGYDFEVGPMIAGLLACLAVRFYVSKTEPAHRWTVDMPVTALALFFTAGTIISQRPAPLMALMYGTGLGAFGVGIIQFALSFVQHNLPHFGDDEPPAPKPPAA